MFAWRILRYIFLVVVVIFLLIHSILNYIIAPYLEDHLPRLTKSLGVKIGVDSIYFYPFYPAIDIKNLTVDGSRGRVARIELISVTFSPLALLRKEIKFYHILVRKGDIDIRTDENFKPINFSIPSSNGKETGENSSPFRIVIGNVVLEKLFVSLNARGVLSIKQYIRAMTFNMNTGFGNLFLDKGELSVSSLKFNVSHAEFPFLFKDGDISVNGGVLQLENPRSYIKLKVDIINVSNPYVSIAFTGRTSLSFLNEQIVKHPDIDGDVVFDGSLRAGRDVSLLIMGALKGKGHLEGEKFDIAHMDFRVDPAGVTLNRMSMDFSGGKLVGDFFMNLKSQKIKTSFFVRGLDFHRFPWTRRVLKGSGNFDVSVTGKLTPLQLDYDVRNFSGNLLLLVEALKGIEFPGPGKASVKGSVSSSIVSVENLTWSGEEEFQVRNFKLYLKDITNGGNLTIKKLNLSMLRPLLGFDARGRVKGTLKWQYSMKSGISIQGKVTGHRVETPYLIVDRISGPFYLKRGELGLTLRADRNKGILLVSGKLKPSNIRSFLNMGVEFKDFPVRAIPMLADEYLDGLVNGNVTVKGAFPRHDLHVKLKVKGRYRGEKLEANIVAISREEGKFDFKGTKIALGRSRVTLVGWMDERGNLGTTAFLFVSRLPRFLAAGFDLNNAEIKINITGSIEKPFLTVNGAVQRVYAGGISLKRLFLYLYGSRDILFVTLKQQNFFIGGTVDLARDFWYASFYGKDTSWSRLLGFDNYLHLKGEIKFKAKGTLKNFEIVSGSGEIDGLTIEKEHLVFKGPFRFKAENNLIKASGEIKGTGGEVYIDFSTELFKSIEWSINGYLDFFYVGILIPGLLNSGGYLMLDFYSREKWGNFIPSGKINFVNTSITLEGFPQKVDINGDVLFSEDRVLFKGLKLATGNGSGILRGEIALDNLKPSNYNLFMDFQNVEITAFEDMDFLVSGNLNFVGPAESPVLGGDIELIRGVITRKINIEKELLTKKRSVENLPGRNDIKLNLRVFSRGNFFIQNNLADMELKFELLVNGTIHRPQFLGTVEMLKGSIFFRERKFYLDRGTVNFNGIYPPDPYIDARFNAEITDLKDNFVYRIILIAQGKASNIKIFLDSQPSLPEADILSLIVFGVKTSSLINPSTGGSTSAVETGNIIFGHQLGTLEGKMEEIMGFDVISISPSFSDVSKRSTFKIKLTKRLSPKVDVTFSTSDYQELEVGYIVNRNIKLGFGWDNKVSTFPGNFSISPHLYYEFDW